MELIITNPLAVPDFIPNSFSVHITVMHGDADQYTSFVMPSFDASNQLRVELMKDLLRTLAKMKAAFEYTGRGGNESECYASKVPEFEPWFSAEDLTKDYSNAWYKPHSTAGTEHLMSLAQEVHHLYAEHGYIEWPSDVTLTGFDLHGEATLESYEVRYLNADGIEHAVEIQD